MWRDFVSQHGLRPNGPARESDIAAAERALGCGWPRELRELLLATDGVLDEHGGALVRPVADIVVATRQMWALDGEGLYMAFSPHVFFGQEANGDEYFFRSLGADATEDIFAWSHEDDSRSNYAYDLRTYVANRVEESRRAFDPEFEYATLDAFLNCLAFVALSGDDTVRPDAAVRELESVAAALRAAPEVQRRAFAGRAQGLAAKEPDEARAGFFRTVSTDLGLFPGAG